MNTENPSGFSNEAMGFIRKLRSAPLNLAINWQFKENVMNKLVGVILFAASFNVFAQSQQNQTSSPATIPGYVTNANSLPGYVSQGHENNNTGAVVYAVKRLNTPYSYNGGHWNNNPIVYPQAYQQSLPSGYGY